MELRNLRTFQTVANHLNLTKAAEQLGYSQPTITLQIKALEKELGKTLFNRVGKRTFLTPTGKLLKQHTDKLFAVLDEMEEDLKKLDNPFGSLVVAAPEFFCTTYLSLILRLYVQEHPQVKLQLISCNSQEAIRLIATNKADIGIISGQCDAPRLVSDVIDQEQFVLVATPELMQGSSKEQVMAEYPFISFQQGCNLDHFIGHCLAEIGYEPRNVIECSSEETIKRAVLNHTGVAMLSKALIADEIAASKLTVLHQFANTADTTLICIKERAQEATIQTFTNLVHAQWTTLLAK
ncbi:LysR family transcriptional regulator [Brevibacillus fulvus]|uniref:DNA-binding transcriptional LysR family regulator n=1 Tax=Brevibacillus fulvus TaxID=1125967 RepID=A0A938Y013_9BACL|nr:LysR family transcriptional regulator [Brevibacillus fulvus]MBM7590698.1 DNA-binding transcriptional LysR family regulator [Brevibacillus fulvus]